MRISNIHRSILLLLAILSLGVAKGQSLKVGAAISNITPADYYFPFEDDHEQYPYAGVHDSLYSRVVVMEEGKERVVIVELDATSVPRPQELIGKVAAAASTSADKVLITVSHTHSALHLSERDKRLTPLVEYTISQTIDAAKRAASNMQTASARFFRTQADANINNGEAVQSNGQYDDQGFSDKTLDMIVLSDKNGRPLATLMSYASHAEVMFRSVTDAKGYEITGDLPGRVATLMQEHDCFGPLVLTMPSAEGDQQPLFTSKQRTQNQGTIDQHEGGWAVLDVLARRIVDAALTAVKTGSTNKDEYQGLRMQSDIVTVPGQNYHHNWQTGENNLQDTDDVQIVIKRLQIGAIQIYAIAADIASEIGSNIRKSAGSKPTMIVTNMAPSVGYVLTDKAYERPGHGVYASKVKPGFAEKALIEGFKNIK